MLHYYVNQTLSMQILIHSGNSGIYVIVLVENSFQNPEIACEKPLALKELFLMKEWIL